MNNMSLQQMENRIEYHYLIMLVFIILASMTSTLIHSSHKLARDEAYISSLRSFQDDVENPDFPQINSPDETWSF